MKMRTLIVDHEETDIPEGWQVKKSYPLHGTNILLLLVSIEDEKMSAADEIANAASLFLHSAPASVLFSMWEDVHRGEIIERVIPIDKDGLFDAHDRLLGAVARFNGVKS